MVFLVSIEGNIGSGKSTLISRLRSKFSTSEKRELPAICYDFVQEPVKEWVREDDSTDPPGPSMLDLFYMNPQRNGFAFQMYVLLTRAKSLASAAAPVVVTERCLESDAMIFERLGRDTGLISDVEHRTYSAWYDTASKTMFKDRPDATVYIRCSPEVCVDRMTLRGRAEESRVGIEYVRSLYAAHERYIEHVKERGSPLMVIDVDDKTPDEVADAVEFFVSTLTAPRQGCTTDLLVWRDAPNQKLDQKQKDSV